MKRIICALLAFCMCFSSLLLVGCGGTGDGGEKISIITTIFPEYDWVSEILGENKDKAELRMLLDSGVDLHNYQPTAADIVALSKCDMFIYVGGHSDEWVDDVLRQANNPDMIVINLFEVLGDAVIEEEHHGDHEEDGDHAHIHEEDEHVWTSVCNAKTVCRVIAEKLSELDPDGKEVYEKNLEDYITRLDALDASYRTAIEASPKRTLLFADRFPFAYLAEEYGLECYAAFSGCSAESEASFEVIASLAAKVDELSLSAVLKIEGSDGKIAETVINTTKSKNAKILTLDSMQAVTKKDIEDGASYISIMEGNLEVIKEALE